MHLPVKVHAQAEIFAYGRNIAGSIVVNLTCLGGFARSVINMISELRECLLRVGNDCVQNPQWRGVL